MYWPYSLRVGRFCILFLYKDDPVHTLKENKYDIVEAFLYTWSGVCGLMQYVKNIGLSDGFAFTDVYDLSDDGLSSVPLPVLALLMLFPKKV